MVSADQPASRRLPEPPPITEPLCEQARIERIPLIAADAASGGADAESQQDYAVVLRAVPPT